MGVWGTLIAPPLPPPSDLVALVAGGPGGLVALVDWWPWWTGGRCPAKKKFQKIFHLFSFFNLTFSKKGV